ncbi:hypothetical protein R1flu_027389 [Riccia fluitans]|uniref:Uncharacterized protein n=1 Tax=Riccia fluitans TaxID=41844 RepID=A0ABD1XLN3_9MARC
MSTATEVYYGERGMEAVIRLVKRRTKQTMTGHWVRSNGQGPAAGPTDRQTQHRAPVGQTDLNGNNKVAVAEDRGSSCTTWPAGNHLFAPSSTTLFLSACTALILFQMPPSVDKSERAISAQSDVAKNLPAVETGCLIWFDTGLSPSVR